MVGPDTLNQAHESKVEECSLVFNSYYDFGAGFDWSAEFPMLLNMVEALDKTEHLDLSHEFSMLLDMVEALDKSESPLKNESTPLNTGAAIQKFKLISTGDKSHDWSKEYHVLFGNKSPTHCSDDDLDWSIEYKTLFGCSSGKDRSNPNSQGQACRRLDFN